MHDTAIFLPLREQYERLRSGSLSAVQLVETAMANYANRGKHDHVYIVWNGPAALEAARATDGVLQRGGDTGPLMGIPVSVKDLYAVPGYPTYAGSARRLPEKWEQAGPIIGHLLRQLPSLMGKTHTVEFAFGGLGTNTHWGTPRNPWDRLNHRTPGGSSAGAGVSLVGGTASLALGTDTAGSVRVPASMTGVAGLKITAGRWPTRQIVPLSPTLDSPGLLAHRAEDLAFAFAALDAHLSDRRERLLKVPKLSNLVFGVPEAYFWDDCSPGIAEVVSDAIRRLEKAGARIVRLDLPRANEAFTLFKAGGVAAVELAAFLNTELPEMIESLDPSVAARISVTDQMPAWEYVRRRDVINSLYSDAVQPLAEVDALLTPTVPITPPTLESLIPEGEYQKANMRALRNTVIANFLGLCSLTLPVGKDAAEMPVGLQLLASPWQDARLLAIGQAVEAQLGCSLDILGPPPVI
ncbi:amidase [Billgrantia antri]|uniref:amidase n=1 Tax=Billgrantia antri TaxID=2846777 RepID=UPI003B223BDE